MGSMAAFDQTGASIAPFVVLLVSNFCRITEQMSFSMHQYATP